MSAKKQSTTDPALLREGAYGNTSLLQKRKNLYQYAKPFINRDEEIIKAAALEGHETILEVGCGTGELLLKIAQEFPTTRLVGIDISAAMYKESSKKALEQHANLRYLTGDIQHLFFSDESFDRVLALHMLHHVPDISKALEEAKRVLKPGGKLIITTGSQKSLLKLQLFEEKVKAMLPSNERLENMSRFVVENAQHMISAHFQTVQYTQFENTIILDHAQPFVDYFDSLRDFWATYPTGEEWQQVLTFVKTKVEKEIKQKGVFEDTNKWGMFIAST